MLLRDFLLETKERVKAKLINMEEIIIKLL